MHQPGEPFGFDDVIYNPNPNDPSVNKPKRGFAAMSDDRRREVASLGGKTAHQNGTAHRFTSNEAKRAGRKGGKIAHEKGTAHEFTSDEARIAGQRGRLVGSFTSF